MSMMLLACELLILLWNVSLENSELRKLLLVVVPIETSIIYDRVKTGESFTKSELFWIIPIILFVQTL
jgi:hypothetical protein